MARQPINEISALQTREALWAVIRTVGRPFTATEVRHQTRCSAGQVGEYLKGLLAAGILALDYDAKAPGNPPGTAHRYTLARDMGVDAPRVRRDGSLVTQGSGRDNMWQTMRALKRFTAFDLHLFAATDDHPIALNEAEYYCRFLALAGYLVKAAGSYRLVMVHGPKPPMIQRVKAVYDPNLGRVVWTQGLDRTEEADHAD